MPEKRRTVLYRKQLQREHSRYGMECESVRHLHFDSSKNHNKFIILCLIKERQPPHKGWALSQSEIYSNAIYLRKVLSKFSTPDLHHSYCKCLNEIFGGPNWNFLLQKLGLRARHATGKTEQECNHGREPRQDSTVTSISEEVDKGSNSKGFLLLLILLLFSHHHSCS